MVSRNTFKNHGRKFKPDPPVRKRKTDMVSMDARSDEEEYDSGADSDDGPGVRVPPEVAWHRVFSKANGDVAFGRGGLTARQVLMLLLDWMCSCLLYTSPSPRDRSLSRMPSSA